MERKIKINLKIFKWNVISDPKNLSNLRQCSAEQFLNKAVLEHCADKGRAVWVR